ncbi:MAG: LuxR C-terminal-related transcriptional regulator [Anaerolineae bacterium]
MTLILATKLYAPPIRSELVMRQRLLDKLSAPRHRKLTLISAPAGFGKTTLVSEWIAQADLSFAWLSLDANDADPIRFLTYLLKALQMVHLDFGHDLVDILQTSQTLQADLIVSQIINELVMLDQGMVLVLDDYHALDSTAIDDIIAFLLDHLPPQLHLVITTREDPSFSTARLRARGELLEFRADDLRFTVSEATAFLNQQMGFDLQLEAVEKLEARTEGWIAALQMVAISMRDRVDTTDFIDNFTGSHRYILDYLVDEVLRYQPPEIVDFLLQTALLDRMCGALCNAVTERHNGQEMLELLEQKNMLVVPLDDERQWYRYHHLFADVLQARARKDYPQHVSIWLSRASQWHEDKGLRSDAIQYALAAKDFEQSANLIELSWPFVAQNIQAAEFLKWSKMLPDDILESRPVLVAAYAWALLDTRNLDEAEKYLKKAENWLDIIDEQGNHGAIIVNQAQFKLLAGTTATARAYLAQTRHNMNETVYHAQRALALLKQDQHYWRGLTALFLGLAQWANSELDEAYRAVSDSIQSLGAADNLYFQVYATVVLAEIRVLQGKLHQAQDHYLQALQLAQNSGSRSVPVSISFYVGLGALYLEWNDLETAKQQISIGAKQLSRALIGFDAYRLKTVLAQIYMVEGHYDDAMSLLTEAKKDFKAGTAPNILSPESLRARFLLKQGRLDDVLDWIQQHKLSTQDALKFSNEFDHMTLARVKLAQYLQQPDEKELTDLLNFLERLRQSAEEGGRVGRVLEIIVLQSLAYQSSGHMQDALRYIQETLKLAEPEGYVRLFIDEGLPMRDLLSASLTDGAAAPYILSLLQQMSAMDDSDTTPLSANELLIEPLSNREMDVLELVAKGLTNQAIADELFIAVSTVKKHINNILGKLGVDNRTQAVKRASELNIL